MPEEPDPVVDVSSLTFPADGYTDSEDPWDPVFGPEEGISMHHVRFRPFTPQPLEDIEEEGTAPYDDIGDAFTMINDGEWHSITLTNFGASNETNEIEAWYYWTTPPYYGVWGKLDLNRFYGAVYNGVDPWEGENVRVEIRFPEWRGRWNPTAEAFLVDDESFDEDDPDFYLLDAYDGVYYESGSMTMRGGSRIRNNSNLFAMSETGVWYFRFNSDEAQFTLRYRVTARVPGPPGVATRAEWGPSYTYEATEVIHPDNTWSTVIGDFVSVNTASSDEFIYNKSPQIWPPTFRLDTSDLPHGLYNLRVRGRWSSDPDNFEDFITTPVRNGLYVHGVNISPSGGEQNFEYYTQIDHEGWWDFELDPQTEQPALYFVAPFFLVLTGDVIDVIVADWNENHGVEIDLLALEKVHSVVPAGLFDITRFEENPIGNEFSGPLPTAMTGDIDADQFQGLEPRDAGWIDWDFVAMQNGDCYVMVHEELNGVFPGTPPSLYHHYFSLRKYDAGSGDWTTIATNIGPGNWVEGDKSPRGGVSMAYESESTFLVAWWEWTGVYFGAPNTNYFAGKEFKWHVARYSTDGSNTELGSGQTMGLGAGGLGTMVEGYYPPQIEVSPTGSIYVCTVQHDDSAPSFLGSKVFCERWTGGGWQNTNLPQLASSGPGDILNAPEQAMGSPIVMTMGRADGNPNFPTVQVGYDQNVTTIGTQAWWDRYRVRTMQYNGSSWDTHDMSTTYLDHWWRDTDLEGAGGNPDLYEEFSYQRRASNMAIAYVSGRIYSVITRFGNFTPVFDMYIMSEDFSEWIACTPKHPMIVIGDTWWYQGGLIEGADGKPTWMANDDYGYYYVVKLEDVGTGGYTVISDVNMPLYGFVYHSISPKMKRQGNKLYVLSTQDVYDADEDGYWDNLGLFMFRGTLVEDFDRTWQPFPEVSLTRVRFAAGEEIVEDEESP